MQHLWPKIHLFQEQANEDEPPPEDEVGLNADGEAMEHDCFCSGWLLKPSIFVQFLHVQNLFKDLGWSIPSY